MVIIDHMIGLDTPKLHVPSEFHVSYKFTFNLKYINSIFEIFSQLFQTEVGLSTRSAEIKANGG